MISKKSNIIYEIWDGAIYIATTDSIQIVELALEKGLQIIKYEA
jgi:hypothetical protein